jgi:hypothetical protein
LGGERLDVGRDRALAGDEFTAGDRQLRPTGDRLGNRGGDIGIGSSEGPTAPSRR